MAIKFYVVNHKNNERRQRMIDRFDKFGIIPKFIPEAINDHDPRVVELDKTYVPGGFSVISQMVNHLDCIQHFANTSEEGDYGVVCEDDIHLHKDMMTILPRLIIDYEKHGLDIMLLGYLMNHKIIPNDAYRNQCLGIRKVSESEDGSISYFDYGKELWGAQMYLFNLRAAKSIIETLNMEYARSGLHTYSPDWAITKFGRKMCIYPMMGVEEGMSTSQAHLGQYAFHMACHYANYDPTMYS